MKKITAMILAVFMLTSFTVCAENKKSGEERTFVTENARTNVSAENNSAKNTLPEIVLEPAESESVNQEGGVKILVAYFSATNTTKGIATHIADSLSADLYEIVPEQSYTDADLNYHDDNSRSTIEMNNSSARPAISGFVENMEQYEIVFIGYPIWWGEAPRILSTFIESYDFSGKTIVPFCTSGSSKIGFSAINLEALTDGATWLSGTRLSGGSSRDEIVNWVNGLGLEIKAE